MARAYNGAFSPFFSAPRVRTILSNVDDLEHLAESALAVSGSWVDRLFETCPFPLQPSKHLEVQPFRQITIEGEIEFYSRTPWLALCEALDLICLGSWAGLPAQHGLKMVTAIPTTLIQFGETMSDVYADLRWKYFVDALEHELDEKALAREVINAVSPVGKLIVSKEGRQAGYKLGYESGYWSGYEAMAEANSALRDRNTGLPLRARMGRRFTSSRSPTSPTSIPNSPAFAWKIT